MPRASSELFWVENMARDLGLDGRMESWPLDPPDVVITTESGLQIGVEVREVFSKETSKGAPDRERAGRYRSLLNQIRDQYYSRANARPLNVRALFPPYLDSPHVRRLTRAEEQEGMRQARTSALSKLEQLQNLGDGETVRFKVELSIRGGAPIRMSATGLPSTGAVAQELATRWQASTGPGWVAQASAEYLQACVAEKNKRVHHYPSQFSYKLLLLVAAGTGPGSYMTVADGLCIDELDFDAVFFMRGMHGTWCISSPFEIPQSMRSSTCRTRNL